MIFYLFYRYKPDFDDLFLKRTLQCKQCGRRFSDDATGKKKFEDHLDMHFRQKRKANQNIGRGHSRSWFTALDVSLSPHYLHLIQAIDIFPVGLDS